MIYNLLEVYLGKTIFKIILLNFFQPFYREIKHFTKENNKLVKNCLDFTLICKTLNKNYFLTFMWIFNDYLDI